MSDQILIPKTSELLLQDIKTILMQLASDEANTVDSALWFYRPMNFLMSLLPVVISLEQSGKEVNPISFMSLQSLEPWMSGLERDPDFKNSGVLLSNLKKFLEVLPGYKKDCIGKQEQCSHDKYGYNIVMARGLCEFTKSFQFRLIEPDVCIS